MNFLQMVQFVQGNIGTSVDLPFAGPSTLVNATGQYLELKNYVQQAYKTIQLDQENWRWRTQPMQLTLLAGQNFYTVAQIQAQVPDYEEIIHFHFIDDTQYGLVAQNQAAPASTTTVGSLEENVDTWYVTLANVGTFSRFDQVLVGSGGNHIAGLIQSVNGSIISFSAESLTIVGNPLSIPGGSAVTYIGEFNPPNVADQTFAWYINYQNWRGWKDRNSLPTGKPCYYTKIPDGSLEFNPIPDATTAPYVFFCDYRVAIDTLVSNTDTPAYLPDRYHECIPWRAIMYWSRSRGKADVYTSAKIEYDRIMNKMYTEQLPDIEPYLRDMYG